MFLAGNGELLPLKISLKASKLAGFEVKVALHTMQLFFSLSAYSGRHQLQLAHIFQGFTLAQGFFMARTP